MKIKQIVGLLLLCSFMIACGRPAGDIAINIEKKASSMTVTHGEIYAAEPDTYHGRETVFYTFRLSNFDMGTKDDSNRGLGPSLTSAEQKKIVFSIMTGEDGSLGTKLRDGVYSNSQATHVTPGLEMGSYRVFTFHDGEEDQWARLGGTKDSFVNIISVKDDTVTGEIELVDGEDSVKGKFTAKMRRKG